jgi:hypothetical protein
MTAQPTSRPRRSTLLRVFPLVALATLALFTAASAEITDFGLTKSRVFVQNTAGAPIIHPDEPFIVAASVTLSQPVPEASGFVLRPGGGAPLPLFHSPLLGTMFFAEAFASEQELHAAFPWGNYTFSITLGGVTSTAILNFQAAPFPAAPRILNFDDLQEADASQPTPIIWSAFTEGVAGDFIMVEAGDFQTPDPTEPGSLPHTATSITVPANILEPATSNDSLVYFARIAGRNTQSIPGANGYATVGTWTEFPIQTIGAPGGLHITTTSLPAATLGQAYSATLSASQPVLFWSVDPDELPPGITFQPLSGTLQGTPTAAGTFSIEFMVFSTDFMSSATRRLSLSVASGAARPPSPAVTSSTWRDGTFTLVLASPLGDEVVIETSSDLLVWQPLANATPNQGVIEFLDTPPPTVRARFYRARWR